MTQRRQKSKSTHRLPMTIFTAMVAVVVAVQFLALLQHQQVEAFSATHGISPHSNGLLTSTVSFERTITAATSLCAQGSGSDNNGSTNDSTNSNDKQKRRRKRSSSNKKKRPPPPKNPSALETWRYYDISLAPHEMPTLPVSKQTLQERYVTPILITRIKERLGIKQGDIASLHHVEVVRRSLDARKRRRQREDPKFVHVVDITLTARDAYRFRLSPLSGKCERIMVDPSNQEDADSTPDSDTKSATTSNNETIPNKKVIIVGAGPAGLFCALVLAQSGKVTPVLLERGQPVERRGRDIGALVHRSQMNVESNFAFGEGGAGTWSDGKLTTRIGRNSDPVRWILRSLVEYGAPEQILVEGSPHLGTDMLVRLLRNMRADLINRWGAQVEFGTKVVDINMDKKENENLTKESACRITGVNVVRVGEEEITSMEADATVLATGHSARDVYQKLHKAGIVLEPKGFAVGFRVEHPQSRITQIQYGDDWGPNVITGKKLTDLANQDYFTQREEQVEKEEHMEEEQATKEGRLPVPSYRLATDQAFDGTNKRGVYSFCMCPGGQIVPASTDPDEVCVNGMSFSKRDSLWANSALVVTIDPDDAILEDYRKEHGVLAGVAFQQDMERRASVLGGGNLVVPVQRVTDFVSGVVSETVPSSSYRLGVKSAPCHEIYPSPLTDAIRDALQQKFATQMPGYVHPDGLLHGVETRTSSPVRVSREIGTCLATGTMNLYPAGEGAGFAGGIVSAAVDGMAVAEAILEQLCGNDKSQDEEPKEKAKPVGFSY